MTEKFNVDPAEVGTFSTSLQKLSEDNANTDSYLKKWLEVDDGVFGDGGLFVIGAKAVRDALDKLQPNYVALGQLTSAAAVELSVAAQMYRTTDKARAEELDRTYPSGDE
ncbi:type VII secretion target [Nocardia sp. NPDC052112]|uniref:type VII secretion target n=1 Tax=Nocardia sp. NPDC052112 TaxID=3155646 RepID=UPI00341601F4